MRLAALAASVSVARSHLEPLRVLPERRLPADSSLPGHTPAHEARCLGVGNAVMSTPISAISTSAVRCLTPGMRHQQVTLARRKGRSAPRSRRESVDRLVEEVDVREDLPDDQRVLGVEAPLERLAQRGDLLAQLARARARRARPGRSCPATSASSMSRPDLPRMSVATQPSLIPVSSRILCSRAASRWRSLICALRYRVRLRSVRIGLGGTRLARNSPASSSWQSHCASFTSVLRPGTCLTWRALTSISSKRSSRIAQHRLPVHAGRFHRDLLDSERLEPVAQRRADPWTVVWNSAMCSCELAAVPDAHARRDARLVHIQRARALNDPAPSLSLLRQVDDDRRPREPRIHKRCCSACSRQQSGVPAKAPTPDFHGLTGTRRRSASARGAHIVNPKPRRDSRNLDFTRRGWRPRHNDFHETRGVSAENSRADPLLLCVGNRLKGSPVSRSLGRQIGSADR